MTDALGNHDIVPEKATSQPPTVHINDLPHEILLDVFAHMHPVELKDLRLVCRKWNYVVSDKAAWTKAFHNRFGTGNVFASVTGSRMWLTEYLGRVAVSRKWAKGRAFSHSYALTNNEFGLRIPPRVFVDFTHDRLLTFARFSGAISMCTMSTGRNQVFFPENSMLSMGMVADCNWSHLCVGKPNGEVLLKNLLTSSATASGMQGVTALQGQTDDPIMSITMNEVFHKHTEKVEIIAGTTGGLLLLWSSNKLLRTIFVSQTTGVLEVASDFVNVVVAVTEEEIVCYELNTGEETHRIKHKLPFTSDFGFHIDIVDRNVICHNEKEVKVYHFSDEVYVRSASAPPDATFMSGKLQKSTRKERNLDLAGGDGRLFALILSDGSVVTFNVRETDSEIKFLTRIKPRYDAPIGILDWTAVELNSSILAIGLVPNYVHFYDAYSGEYLREGVKVPRKLFRAGEPPIRHMEFSDTQAAGVIVAGSVAQYYRFGEDAVAAKKKPNTPQAEGSSRNVMHQHIKAQLEDYETLEHSRQQAALLADRYNGTEHESELEELRMAMALSASSVPDTSEDDELERALALSREESEQAAIPVEGSSRLHEFFKQPATGHPGEPVESDEDEVLRQVIELSLREH